MADVPEKLGLLRIEEIGLSIRCYRHLKRNGVNNIRELLAAPEEVLKPYFAELNAGLRRVRKLYETGRYDGG